MPTVTVDRLLVAVVKKPSHINGIEALLMLDCEIRPNIGEVVVDTVTPGGRVYPQHIVIAAIMDHRCNRPSRNRQESSIHRRPLGVEPATANDVGVTLTRQGPCRRLTRMPIWGG